MDRNDVDGKYQIYKRGETQFALINWSKSDLHSVQYNKYGEWLSDSIRNHQTQRNDVMK